MATYNDSLSEILSPTEARNCAWPYPRGWPPRVHSSTRSIRYYLSAVATANFSDNAYLFASGSGGSANTYTPLTPINSAQIYAGVTAANPTVTAPSIAGTGVADKDSPVAMVWSMGIRIVNSGVGAMEYSFDGTNVHGRLNDGETAVYNRRHEAGISFRGVGGATPTIKIDAW